MGEPTATDFCNDYTSLCPSDPAWGTSASECTRIASNLAVSAVSPAAGPEVSGNTLGCRVYHLGVAASQSSQSARDLHCGHASSTGRQVCVGHPAVLQFCSSFISTCGTQMGWADESECADTAEQLIRGDLNDASGDTLECRIYHLGVARNSTAASDRDFHCGHASAAGNDVCVETPTSRQFCDDFITTCGTSEGDWATTDQCQAAQLSTIAGADGATSGDTTACRMYHLGVAKMRNGIGAHLRTHCSHASSNGGGVCTGAPSVADFCAEYAATCSMNATVCQGWAANLTAGTVGDISGNTLACRAYHVLAAKSNAPPGAEAHCGHASQLGGGVCVDATPETNEDINGVFCDDFILTCGTERGYISAQQCRSGVSAYRSGEVGDQDGDSFACRNTYLQMALNGDRVDLNCDSASPDSRVCADLQVAASSSSSSADHDDLGDAAITAIFLAVIFGIFIIVIAEMHYQRAAREHRNYIAKERARAPSGTVAMHSNPTYVAGAVPAGAAAKSEEYGFNG